MKNTKKIHEIAKLFDIPVSTLHYWEKEGLFSVEREQNQYRTYSLADIMDIWEILFYRQLDIPIRDIKEILQNDVENLENIYESNERKLKSQIQDLQRKLKRIEKQKNIISQVQFLKENSPYMAAPDLFCCIEDKFQIETIQGALENPYNCCLVIEKEEERYVRGFCTEIDSKEEKIWIRRDDVEYIEFLLKVDIRNPADNNLSEIYEFVEQLGGKTGNVIARYLLMDGREEKRWEYYRAWMEMEKK